MRRKFILKGVACLLSISIFTQIIPMSVLAAQPTSEIDPLKVSPPDFTQIQAEENEQEMIVEEVVEKRDEYTKHFRTKMGGFVAATYDYPVHFQEEETNTWKEIDNSLKFDASEQVYHNNESEMDVEFAESSDQQELVSIAQENHTLSWSVAPVIQIRAANEETIPSKFVVTPMDQEISLMSEELEPQTQEEIVEYNQKQMGVSNSISQGTYPDLLPDIDFQYTLFGNTVKENIILKTQLAGMQDISLMISHPGLELELQEDGSIISFESGDETKEIIYQFTVPYMIDANGETSDLVSYQLQPGSDDDTTRLTFLPDQNWLSQPERAYPVTIDPMTETSKSTQNIEDTFISENQPNISGLSSYGSFVVGNNYSEGKCRAYIRFKNLPKLDPGDIIYKGVLSVWQYDFDAVGTQSLDISAHSTDGWSTKTTWNTRPDFDETILDYTTIKPVRTTGDGVINITYTEHHLDVTSLVRGWYNTGINNGIMLKSDEENRKAFGRFFTCNYPFNTSGNLTGSSEQFPSGIFLYKNASGLEDYWSYHQQSVGQAGSGYTHDYTGNLVFAHDDTSTQGSLSPVSVSHIYNLTESDNSSRFGYGWRLNVMEQFLPTGISESPYVYIDSDGTKHYFTKDNEDEDGLGLKLTKVDTSSNDFRYYLETKDKLTLKFDVWGYLRRVVDTNGNTISYNYGPNAAGNVLGNLTDGAGHAIYFHYNDDQTRLTSITDTAGREISYEYDDSGNLTSITYPDGKKSTYTYNGHKLIKATSPDGYSVNYEYTNDMSVPRVSKITETSGEKTGQALKISYQNGNTTIFEDSGIDGNIDTTEDNLITTYHFDNLGQPTDVHDNEGGANSYEYYKTESDEHRLKETGHTTKTSFNPVLNGGFNSTIENMDGWNHYGDSGAQYGVIREKDKGYYNNDSIHIIQNTKDKSAGVSEDIAVSPGTYTLSVYVYTNGIVPNETEGAGAVLSAVLKDKNGNHKENIRSEPVIEDSDDTLNGGWRRIRITFDVTEDTPRVLIRGELYQSTGQAWFDGFQLDKGETENKYNLINNPSFEYMSGSTIIGWHGEGGSSTAATKDGSRSLTIPGGKTTDPKMHVNVPVSGPEGDTYSLSGWAKGAALPPKEGKDRLFYLSAAVIYSDGSTKWEHASFNPYVTDWQFLNTVINTDDGDDSTNKTYTAIHVYMFWRQQANPVYFDGIQLVKDLSQSYTYDEEGNPISVKDSVEQSKFDFDANNNLKELVDPTGFSFSYNYDSKQNMTSAHSSDGLNYSFSYNEKGNPTSSLVSGEKQSVVMGKTYFIRNKATGKYIDVTGVQDKDNANVAQWEFTDGRNQKWILEDARDGTVKIIASYSSAGRVIDIEGGVSNEKANIVINSPGETSSQKYQLKQMQDGSYQIVSGSYAISSDGGYDNGSNIYLSKTDSNNSRWYFEEVTETITDIPQDKGLYQIYARHSGQYLTVSEDGKLQQSYQNGNASQQITLEAVPGEEGTFYLLPQSGNGKVLQWSDALALSQFHTVELADKSDSDRQKFKFTENDDHTYRITCKSSNTEFDVMNVTYNDGETIIFTNYSGGKNQEFVLEQIDNKIATSMTYTSDKSQVASVTDSRGYTVTNNYDTNNRLQTGVTDTLGNTVNYTYDSDTDQMTKVSKMVNGQEYFNEYTYDYYNLKTITRNGFSYQFDYNDFGNITDTWVGNQLLSHNDYLSNNGLLKSSAYGNGNVISYSYDKYGRIVSTSYDDKTAFEYTFDSDGNPLGHRDIINGVDYRYDYDMTGRLVNMDTSHDQHMSIHYDDKNRIKDTISKVGDTSVKTEYLYGDKAKFQKEGLIYGINVNGNELLSYSYDDLARTSSRILQLDSPYQTTYSYIPGIDGSSTIMVESVQNGENTISYTYDEIGNIKSISENGELMASYEYDELNQLVREDNKLLDKTIEYIYANGTMVQRTEYSYSPDMPLSTLKIQNSANKTDLFYYDDFNWKDKLTRVGYQMFTYDEIGNPLNYRDGMEFTWQHGRELATADYNGNQMSYRYDNDGIRTQKTINGVTTDYYLNGSTILTQITGDKRFDFFYDENESLIGFSSEGKNYYYIYNAQSDIIGILDSSGNQVVSYVYDSWGKLTSIDGTLKDTIGVENPFRYRGYYYDTELGMYYTNSRYYDPEYCRFITPDNEEVLFGSESYLSDKNLFSYCDNNPTLRADSNGEFWHHIIGAAVGALVNGVTTVFANVAAGDPWNKNLVTSIGSGAASGLLASFGVPPVWSIAGNAAIGMTEDVINTVSSPEYQRMTPSEKGTSVATSLLRGGITGAVSGASSGAGWGNKNLSSQGKRMVGRIRKTGEVKDAVKYYNKNTKKQIKNGVSMSKEDIAIMVGPKLQIPKIIGYGYRNGRQYTIVSYGNRLVEVY